MSALLPASRVTGLNDPGAWIWSLWAKQEEEDVASSLPRSIQDLGQVAGDTSSLQLDLPWGCTFLSAPQLQTLEEMLLPLESSAILTDQTRPLAVLGIFLCCLTFDIWWFGTQSRTG